MKSVEAAMSAWKEAIDIGLPINVDHHHHRRDRRSRGAQVREWMLWTGAFLFLSAGFLGLCTTSSSMWRGIVRPTFVNSAITTNSTNTAAAAAATAGAGAAPLPSNPCASNDNDDLLVVVKTGSSVMYERILVHMETTLKCIPHKLLVSDADADLGGAFHVVDVIKELDADTLSRPEFEYYHRQQAAHASNDELIDKQARLDHQGWDLDKFKFIPMVYRAWLERRPSTKWFVFVEADTLVDWTNLRLLLNNASSSDPLFYGAPVFINDVAFAHGGSGFVLSHAAMEQSVGRSPHDWLLKWGAEPRKECCGDFLLTLALASFNVSLTGAFPLFQGDPIHLTPILPDRWCRPVVSMHHVSQRQVAAYWTLAGQAGYAYSAKQRPTSLLWHEVFDAFVAPNLKQYKLDWDNGSDDWEFSQSKHAERPDEMETQAVASPGGCERMCRREKECMQWSHHALTCKMSRKVRGGQSAPPRTPNKLDDKWISGWMLDRIEAYRTEHRTCPDGADWSFV